MQACAAQAAAAALMQPCQDACPSHARWKLMARSACPLCGAGGSPYACACAALLPAGRVEALLLVCPLAPTCGREEQLLPGTSPTTLRLFHGIRKHPWRVWATLHLLRLIQVGWAGPRRQGGRTGQGSQQRWRWSRCKHCLPCAWLRLATGFRRPLAHAAHGSPAAEGATRQPAAPHWRICRGGQEGDGRVPRHGGH